MAECLEIAVVPIGGMDPVPIAWLKEDLPKILQAGVKEFPPLRLSPPALPEGTEPVPGGRAAC